MAKEKAEELLNKIDPEKLKRSEKPKPKTVEPEAPKVSLGAVDKVIDLVFNPTRDKIREVTVVDRMQGRFFPQLDMINMMYSYCIEIAIYRQSPEMYAELFPNQSQPKQPNIIDELLFRTAQWQKSVGGKNMDKGLEIAMAETEAKSAEEDMFGGGHDPWKDND